ncbi:MAG: hypothetical protein JXB88_13065 [Spirochaetales bacterium]|nr:hypothetical protein [Spirochaetales bacterium]
MWFLLNIGLTYLVIGFASALIIYYLFKRQVPGNFIGALIVGLIGSFLGGLLYHAFPHIFNFLTDINDVNVYAAFFFSFILIWIFSKLSSHK